MGPVTNEIVIAVLGLALICVLSYYHVNGPFALTIITCSVISWVLNSSWPTHFFSINTSFVRFDFSTFAAHAEVVPLLTLDLVLLYILYLAGLTSSLSRLADLTRDDGTVPRQRWIYVLVGLTTVVCTSLYIVLL